MAKKSAKVEVSFKVKTKKNNAGIHSKKKTSSLKSSKCSFDVYISFG